MRRLMWFTLGFCLACGICVWLVPAHGVIFVLILCTAVTAAAFLFRSNPAMAAAAILGLGCTVGICWFSVYQNQYLHAAEALDERQLYTTITVSDYSYETDYGIGVDGVLSAEGKSYKIRAYINKSVSLSPGDTVTGMFLLRYTVSEASYHSGNGIFLLAYQRGEIEINHASGVELRYFPAILAKNISNILQKCFPQDTFPFAKALLLGDTRELSYELDTALQISGIRHVAAVSGLHVSILFALISMITLKNRFLTALVGFPALALFAALAGFSPSVTRACIMSALLMLGKLLDKEYDGATALSFAVLTMLVQNPLAITSVGLQLSAASVAGIFLFYSPIHNWLFSKMGNPTGKTIPHKLLRWIASSVSVTLSATTLTLPLCALYFGVVSLVGVWTNLLTLWVISFIFYGIMAVCLVYLVLPGAAVVIARLVSIPIRYVLGCAKLFGGFPLAAVYTRSTYVVLWLVFCYVLLAVFLLQKDRKPVVLACCCIIGLCLSLALSWLEPLTDDVRMTVLDVGQGQSILLQSEGKTFLVDCGGDSDEETADTIAETLLSQGISHLDGILITHQDKDHSGALSYLLTRTDTDLLIMPQSEDTPAPPETEGQFICVEEDRILTFDKASIKIYSSGYLGSGNENSLCILFERENCAILITGDRSGFGERMLMRKVQLPHVDVLVAGHHGAADSTCEELLEAVRPENVMISVGKDNRYGHPAQELLERLAKYGCDVYRTDQNGTITFRR